ncbi:MAG: DNA-directed RNA polymerase subunit beta', partial [Planctomycetes bacterium]|nr:DNA-directed RNA polymerase subunit beta' [Planctomycetota bacterium]
CEAFNADFDGDQMAVHLPLSLEAQSEATILMLSTNNIFSPADGGPIIGPSLDMVLGCYYLTLVRPYRPDDPMPVYDTPAEAIMAYDEKKLGLHDPIKIKLRPGTKVVDEEETREIEAESGESSRVVTAVGRIFFSDALPDNALNGSDGVRLPYYNLPLADKQLSKVIIDCHELLGRSKTIELLDAIKNTGFKWATLSGLSIATSDLRTPRRKQEILKKTQTEVDKIERNYRRGVITQTESYHQIIEQWTHAGNAVAEELMDELKNDVRDGQPYLNPLWLMSASGARGSSAQIRQLAGMRGLMTKPSGRIIETPIKANFREGLPVLEYFSSTHGGRKGLADTALKTAESGYLTRKLADVAQNVVISEPDCRTVNGITKSEIRRGETVEVALSQLIRGRCSQEAVTNRLTGEIIVEEGGMITMEQAVQIEGLGYTSLKVRSPMTCESPRGVCAGCYGMDLCTGEIVEEGLAVGIIGAQSIGEPGTQLTMRTFHIGGTAQRTVEEADIRAPVAGTVRFENVQTVLGTDGILVVLNQNGEAVLTEKDGAERRYQLRAGAKLHVGEGDKIKAKGLIAEWDPHVTPIISEKSGTVQFEDIVEEETMREEIDTAGSIRKVIVEHKGDLHPQIIIVGKDREPLAIYSIPEKAILDVDEGDAIAAGTQLARTPREIGRSEDITAGLPRVTELFEARKPKDPAIISEISGIVELGERKRGKRTIIVRNETGIEREHLVPHGKHLTVGKGDKVREGDRLVDGPLIPQDILRISGEEAVQQYLVREIQSVYRTQHETIDDKHIEAIVAQMMRKVRASEDTGDTEFLPGTIVDKFIFRAENERVVGQGGKPASATPLLFGITKAALQSESFISAASFQETTKVLTEAALAGKTDYLLGLKENVILGHMIPAGTGFHRFRRAEVCKKAAPSELQEQEEGAEQIESILTL